jgi:ABC-2 type transport system permease protein
MIRRVRSEGAFVWACFTMNLASAMEYRISFLGQVVGMMLNNGIYFLFWVIFFRRFEQVRGWTLDDMLLLFAIITTSFGLAFSLCGNAPRLARMIAQGQLDYYLALPRPVLLHVLVTRSSISALGDASYGVVTFLFSGRFALAEVGGYIVGSAAAAIVLVSFTVLFNSLAFWMGSATQLADQALNALLMFAQYPASIFQGVAKFIVLTLVPAALVGGLPVQLVNSFEPTTLAVLLAGAAGLSIAAGLLFRAGLRRYESGSALNVRV